MKKELKIYGGITASFLTALVLLSAFWCEGIYPFGWGTVSWCDMNQQLIPLFCDFKDILSGDSSLFLNFSNGGGMNFYGVFFFFLSSPFSFAVAFTDKADIPFLMNILVILKLCVSAFTSAYVLERLTKNIRWGFSCALGTAYALCGYGMLFYQNIMWLDMMYLFPLVVLGAYRLIEENRPLLLTAALTLSVIFNFYISFMVFLFVIFFFGAFALFYPKANRKIYVNLGISGGLSLVASSFVWVPCLLQYLGSARGNSFLEEIKNADFFSHYQTTLIVLLCSGVIFAGLFFVLPKITLVNREIKFLSLVFLITSLPLIIEPVNLMWHTGSYMSFPARYGFIPVFMGLAVTSKLLAEKPEKRGRDYSVPLCITIGLISAYCILFASENQDILSAYIKTLWSDSRALNGLTIICGLFALCAVLVLYFLIKGNLKREIAALLLCIIVASQGICSVNTFILPTKDYLSLYNYQSMVALKDKADKDGFYRVNTIRKITDANMTGASGFNSISHYTSLNDQTFMESAKMLGYSGCWMETGNWGGSILSDAILSVGYTAKKVDGSYTLEENPYFLGLGIKAEGKIPQELSHKDRLLSLGQAFGQIMGTKNPVKKYDYYKTEECSVSETDEGVCVNNLLEVGTIHYTVNVTQPQTLYFDCYNGFSTNLTEEIYNSMAVYVNGTEITSSYPSSEFNGLLQLGSFENKEVNITIKVLETADCTSFGVYSVDENILKKCVSDNQALNLTEEKGKVLGKVQKGSYFISLPYKDNYSITLDGEKLEYSKALSGFISLDIPQSGQLEISFVPKGFYIGLGLSFAGLCLIVLFIYLARKDKIYGEKCKNIVFGIFLGGCAVAVLWVYIIPIIVNLSDFTF